MLRLLRDNAYVAVIGTLSLLVSVYLAFFTPQLPSDGGKLEGLHAGDGNIKQTIRPGSDAKATHFGSGDIEQYVK